MTIRKPDRKLAGGEVAYLTDLFERMKVVPETLDRKAEKEIDAAFDELESDPLAIALNGLSDVQRRRTLAETAEVKRFVDWLTLAQRAAIKARKSNGANVFQHGYQSALEAVGKKFSELFG